MYSLEKFRYGRDLKVKDLIAELAKEDPNATVLVGGCNEVFIHVDEEKNMVSLDHDNYMEQEIDQIERHKIITQDSAIDMLKTITEHLVADSGNEVYNGYRDLGFSRDDIISLYNFTNTED